MNPRYPIYVISKGRWESRLTMKSLDEMSTPYQVVIEPTEYEQYASVIAEDKLLVLPFHDLGKGSIPARNWVWEHALATGAERHWILDDNIRAFFRCHDNKKYYAKTGTVFAAAEDFVDRYENVALAGFQYRMFAPSRQKHHPFALNCRVYSCILIKNDLPYRWRGRYNEDTDLSIRVMKDGWCTILFYAFLAAKIATMHMKGGNTDELYQGDGRLRMAQSLQRQHPDIVKIGRRYGRWQHIVDYSGFRKNKLIRKPDAVIPDQPNNYGMELKQLAPKKRRGVVYE